MSEFDTENYRAHSTFEEKLVKRETILPVGPPAAGSDEFELEFSGSSEPELWNFLAEPSWGTLISELKPSWQYWQYVCQRILILCLYRDFMFNLMNFHKRIGIFGVKHYNLGT